MTTVQADMFKLLRELPIFDSEEQRKAALLMTDYPYIGVYLDFDGSQNDFAQALLETVTGRGQTFTLDFFASLRSPYTAIAFSRVYDLARRSGVELVLRPVLPMVMRGLPVPMEKRLYIVLDTKREAERAGVAFGRVCDPVGRPVERGYSLFPWARERGRAEEFLHGFARAAFAEGIDMGTDAGLRRAEPRTGGDGRGFGR